MKRRWLTALLCLFLGACATAPRERPVRFWSGRIGLQVQSDPPQSLQSSFELQGTPQAGELTLLSPMGNVLAQLRWTPEQAVLERGAERWTQATTAQLAQQLLQTPLPVQTLFDWIEGRASRLEGWEVDLSAQAQGRILARRVHPGPPAQIRIVLDR